MDQEPNKSQDNEPTSLETPEILAEQQPQANIPENPVQQDPSPPGQPQPEDQAPNPTPKTGLRDKLFKRVKSVNIYLLLFILIVIMAVIITFVAYQKSQQPNQQSPATVSETINEDVLKQLRNTDVSVGQPKQILSVEANAVFAGTVLVRGDFETAGQIRSGGPISSSSINVSGTGTFQSIQTSKLDLAGDGQIQGNLAVQNNLSVSGSGNFGGTLSAGKLNIQSLELSGNLVISKHIDASGGNPSKSSGSGLGDGGTSSVSGSDTAGTININTGSSPHAGCFITVNFTQKFSSPHVVVTPIGSSGSSLDYYVTRSPGNFSLCTSSSAPAGKNFSFDYIVID